MNTVYTFKVLYDCGKVEMKRIFPTKQKYVKSIYDRFYDDERIACIILFGSSVSNKCNKWSDLDILVRLNSNEVNDKNKNDISECIQELCDWNADILWYDRIDKNDRIYKHILEGVQIV